MKSNAHYPVLTEPEAALLAEVQAIAPLWSSRMLRKVLGSQTIRGIAHRDPDLVRRAFLIGARDRQTVPMRMWYIEECPHWKRAAQELTAQDETPAGPPAPAPRAPSAPRPPVQRPAHQRTCATSGCDGGYVTADDRQVACPDCRPGTHRRELAQAGVATLAELLTPVADQPAPSPC